ncbi:DUF2635 domain-containing protein [Bradyrhizobium sp. SZCCHNR3003]|uniref:DUF2635 domain-containing protein n=1 Tax=Bradyrhizobium sp. SZCCHNR3003 TaxID=3057387 RepID=UPI002915CCEA|nr:DUF2635 domain-containing protein [Bradyrhizobium sp. SZCCHNR3003]
MNLYLKPAVDAAGKAVLVRDPANWQPLKAEGEHKPPIVYWLRRLRDGDVVEATPPAEAGSSAPTVPPPLAVG